MNATLVAAWRREFHRFADAMGLLLRKAKSTLKALNVELAEANDAQKEPVTFPAGSLLQTAVGVNQAMAVRRSA